MPPLSEDKLNKIEQLKAKLFNKNYQTRVEHRDSFPHFQNKEVPDSWQKEGLREPEVKEQFFMQTSMFKKFFVFSLIFFTLALGYAAYMFFAESNTVSNENIDISVKSAAFTEGGEEYSLLLQVSNKNNTPLELADVVFEYSKNSAVSGSDDKERVRVSLGTIPASGVKNESVKLILYGEQGSKREVKITLEYRVEGSNAIFVKEKLFDIFINSTPVNLLVDAPREATPNQDIDLNIKASLNSGKGVPDVLLRVDYPIGFQFIEANPAPSFGNNVWVLGDLAPGVEREVKISGRMTDVFEGEEKIFRVSSGAPSPRDKYSIGTFFNSSEHSLLVQKPSVETVLFVNGVSSREYAVDSRTSVVGQIQWENNLDTKIKNMQIKAKISGNALDKRTISANEGFYDSSQDVIIWDKNSRNKFAEVSPGEAGNVSFSFYALPLYSASGGVISSPEISIEVFTTGIRPDIGDSVTELSGSEKGIIRIKSDVGLSTKAFYYSGPFTNTGPIPPRAGSKTTYTVSWSLTNTSNSVSKVSVRASLPPWVKMVGSPVPSGENLVYNSSTREVLWTVGTVPKGAGIVAAGKEVSFQIEFIPSLSQTGSTPLIINESVLTGHDDFANVDIKVKRTGLDTKLLNDPGFPFDGGRVSE